MMYCVLPCVLVRRCERSAAAWARCCRKCLRYGCNNNHGDRNYLLSEIIISSSIVYQMNTYSMMLVIVANTCVSVSYLCT